MSVIIGTAIHIAIVIAVLLLMEFAVEPRFRLRRRLLNLTVMRRWPDKRVWWPGMFLYVFGLLAVIAALDAILRSIWPDLADIAGYRFGSIALPVALFMPRKYDWTKPDEPGAGQHPA
jgi:hypothetical protein